MRSGIVLFFFGMTMTGLSQEPKSYPILPPPQDNVLRIASFNTAMNRKTQGELTQALQRGDKQIADIATIVQCVGPDIVLLNEVDYAEPNTDLLLTRFLQTTQPGAPKDNLRQLRYAFTAPVNTGVPSKLDVNNNGRLGEADDAWGYGAFPGQYGMIVCSRFPIVTERVRTFQKFLWSDMPGALRPKSDRFFHSDDVWKQLRLSSKSHWDVPIQVGERTLHILASHPTPPVFDGPEDRNGCRNHDEIRLWIDYILGDEQADYLVDDLGNRGGLPRDARFVILGDLNADPLDGDGKRDAIQKLISHPRIAQGGPIPSSQGGVEASEKSGEANARHQSDPAHDTGDFNDRNPGNLRIDFVLPSTGCRIVASGVYWPSAAESPDGNELVQASDHRLVWVDIELE